MNSTNNNSFEIAAKKVFSDLYALIKEDEKETEYKTDHKKTDDKNEKDNKNVISNEIDDKPKPVNLLDLDNDILNIIGDFVKKDNKRREIQELKDGEQIINGRNIIFPTFCSGEILKTINTKETLKEYIFNYINREFPFIKKYANIYKIRLSKDDKRKCAWVLFKRCKIIIEQNKQYCNKDVYNMDDDDEKEFFEEYLKLNKLNSPKKFEY